MGTGSITSEGVGSSAHRRTFGCAVGSARYCSRSCASSAKLQLRCFPVWWRRELWCAVSAASKAGASFDVLAIAGGRSRISKARAVHRRKSLRSRAASSSVADAVSRATVGSVHTALRGSSRSRFAARACTLRSASFHGASGSCFEVMDLRGMPSVRACQYWPSSSYSSAGRLALPPTMRPTSAMMAPACAARNACAGGGGGACIATSFVCSVVAVHWSASGDAAQPWHPEAEHGARSMSQRLSMQQRPMTRTERAVLYDGRANCPPSK